MSTLAVNAITNAAGGNTATINGMTPTADSLQGFRNRIINGGMVVNQRGGTITPGASGAYGIDRFYGYASGGGVFTAVQSTDAPTGAGFSYSNLLTVTTADSSIGSAEYYSTGQVIEGYNTADLGWGTASAKSIVLSFWAKSTVTGSYSFALYNASASRCYPAQFAIAASDTWQKVELLVAGPTDGTWDTTNGAGITLRIDLGSGTNLNGTANTWNASGAFVGIRTSSNVNWIATSGATFAYTGVQLEAGSVATPFERRPFGTELALCQRYYEQSDGSLEFGAASSAITGSIPYIVQKRATPTFVFTDAVGNVNRVTLESTNNVVVSGGSIGTTGNRYARCRAAITGASTGSFVLWRYTADAEL